MEKLKFTFQVKSTIDGKTNHIAITSIATQDDKIFLIPEEHQTVSLHKHIQSSKTFVTMKNTLKKRHQTRSVWIKTTEDILQTYVDEDVDLSDEIAGFLMTVYTCLRKEENDKPGH